MVHTPFISNPCPTTSILLLLKSCFMDSNPRAALLSVKQDLLVGLVVHDIAELGGEVLQAHGAQVLAGAGADGDGLVLHVPVTHHQHEGHLL